MPHNVIMPALGMAQDTGVLVAWHKSAGDPVAEGDVLFEVETDKATMEVEAQAGGFLTNITAGAGAEVPVGDVIALISESAEGSTDAAPAAPAAAAAAPADDLPQGHIVIMPTLGMAQDSGVLVAWAKSAGEAVTEGDTLFEVETDKSTVEVPADTSGYLAAVLAQAGEDIPTGQTIAIITAEAPANPISRSASEQAPSAAPAAPASAPVAAPAPQAAPAKEAPAKEAPAKTAAPQPVAAIAAGGRILASPKLRRAAATEGLDLQVLVDAGHPQPYHMSDLEALRSLANAAPATAAGSAIAAAQVTALVPQSGLDGFTDWASAQGLTDAQALLAGLSAGALGRDAIVTVDRVVSEATYHAPCGPLSAVTAAADEAAPELIIRDLRRTMVQTALLGAESCPCVTLTAQEGGLALSLEYAPHQMTPKAALSFITQFANRLSDPLTHLL